MIIMRGRVPKEPFFKMVARNWKRGWNEIPEIMCGGIIGTVSFLGCVHYLVTQDPEDLNYRYRPIYTVMRPDDPRLMRVRKYDDSPAPTFTPDGLIPTVGLTARVWESK